jgi:WD40 repeat protein
MATDDLAPEPQVSPPRSRLTWIWPVISFGIIMSACGFWISAFPAISNWPQEQITGSGWWYYGAMGIGSLLVALLGFSSKMSVLSAKRESGLWRLRREKSLDFSMEALGLGTFIGYGVLPLCIHTFNPFWILIFAWVALLGFWLVKRTVSRRSGFVGRLLGHRHDAEVLVADSSRLTRRTLISGGLNLAVGASGLAAIWHMLPTLIPDYTFFVHDDTVNSLSWFPDSRCIASIGYNGQLFIWNADDGSNRRTLASRVSILTKVQVSPNGKLIAASDRSSLSLVDATNGTLLWKKEIGYSGRPFSWAPDSAHVVVLLQHDVRIVDALTGEEAATIFVLSGDFSPEAVAWSPNGKSIAATDGMRIVMWDAASGMQRGTFTVPHITSYALSDFAWSPNGDALALALGPVVYIWFLSNQGAPIAYREHSYHIPAFSIPAISLSPDGRYVASCGSQDKTVRVWEAATGKTVFVYNGHFSPVWTVAWSPDGRRIASGGFDNLVHVWRPILPA